MRILPNGLTELMNNIKIRLSDSNKSVLKAYVTTLGKLADALGPAIKNFSKLLLKPLLANLADKQALLRNEVMASIDKWTEASGGCEAVMNCVGSYVQAENPELRTELLQWALKNKEGLEKCEHKSLVAPLVNCLQDKAPPIRGMAE